MVLASLHDYLHVSPQPTIRNTWHQPVTGIYVDITTTISLTLTAMNVARRTSSLSSSTHFLLLPLNRDSYHFATFSYTTALQAMALFGLDFGRFPAMIGMATFLVLFVYADSFVWSVRAYQTFISSCCTFIPVHKIYARNAVNAFIFEAFLLYVHYTRENVGAVFHLDTEILTLIGSGGAPSVYPSLSAQGPIQGNSEGPGERTQDRRFQKALDLVSICGPHLHTDLIFEIQICFP